MSMKGVNFKLSATNAAGPAFSSFNRGLRGVQKTSQAAQAATRSWNAGLNSQRRAVQQFGFQMSDFAIQIAGGQSAMLAFTQQGGQMLQFFGPAGSILAALVAVFGSLYIAMTRGGVAMNQLYPYLGALENEFRVVVDAVTELVSVFGTMARFLLDHLDVIIIAVAMAVGWFAVRWVAAVVVASVQTGIFANTLRATAFAYYTAGAGAAAATLATSAFTGAIRILRTALIRLGLPALILGMAYLAERFLTLIRGAGSFANAMRLLGDLVRAVFASMGDMVNGFWQNMVAMTQGVAASFTGMLNTMISNFMEFTWSVAEGMNELFNTDRFSGARLGGVTQKLTQVTRGFEEASESAANKAAEHFENAGTRVADAWQAIKDALKAGEVNSPKPDWGTPGEEGGGGGGGGKSPADKMKEEADKIKTIFEDLQSAISDSMMSSFKGLLDGTKSFREAAMDVLGTILNKIIEIMMTPIFDSIAGSIAGGIMGGLSSGGLLSFDGGGFTGRGSRSGGMDGKGGFLGMLHPNETVVDHTKGGSAGEPVNVRVYVDDDGRLQAAIENTSGRVVKTAMAQSRARMESDVVSITRDAQKRGLL